MDAFRGHGFSLPVAKTTLLRGLQLALFPLGSPISTPTLTGFLVTYYGYSSMFMEAAVAVIIGMVTMFFINPDKANTADKKVPSPAFMPE